MSKSIATILFLILFSLPVLAQEEKAPELPDYTKWQLTEWHYNGDAYRYRGAIILLADKHYEYANDKGYHTIGVFYKPVTEEEYESLRNYSDLKNRFLQLAESKGPWFVLYEFIPADKTQKPSMYYYERTRKWHELYRLWYPKWRFAGDWTNFKTGTEADNFIRDKLGLTPVD